jgi:hypothetical protein
MQETKALLDCGASGLFMGKDYIACEGLNMKKLSEPIEVGTITEIADIILCYKGHSERAIFTVTQTGKDNVILGLPWLKQHNPEVDWRTEEVKMSWCPTRCQTCHNEIKKEKMEKKKHQERIAHCQAGPMLHPHVTVEDVEEEDKDDFMTNDLPELQEDDEDEEDEGEEEEGDKVYTVNLEHKPEHIRASRNISQRLTEAALKNSQRKDFCDTVPNYLCDFEDVFAEESFNVLPTHKIWDHAIKLTKDANVSNCKVYLMSRDKQAKLDAYIDKHLLTGRI